MMAADIARATCHQYVQPGRLAKMEAQQIANVTAPQSVHELSNEELMAIAAGFTLGSPDAENSGNQLQH
jgi:hypothetical protein